MATRRQVKKFASTLSDEFLECRRLGHAWKAYTVDMDGPRFVETTLCPRCKSTNVRLIGRDGMVIGKPRPHYSPGYLAHGIGRISGEAKGVLRLEGVHRIMDAQIIGPGSDVVTSISEAQRRRRSGSKS